MNDNLDGFVCGRLERSDRFRQAVGVRGAGNRKDPALYPLLEAFDCLSNLLSIYAMVFGVKAERMLGEEHTRSISGGRKILSERRWSEYAEA